MGSNTGIEWTDRTWSPVTGCTKVSAGCANCYAERNFPRAYPDRHFTDVRKHIDRVNQPLHWRKPRKVFICSMGDLFHRDVPDAFIHDVWQIMADTPRHTYQVLTKRPGRMFAYLHKFKGFATAGLMNDPLPNVWLGVTIEDQENDWRIKYLLDTPAAKRFVSCEPLLGPVDLNPYIECPCCTYGDSAPSGTLPCLCGELLDWVIVGGESGPKARPMHPKWAMDIRDQCQAAEVPYFFKQWGEWKPVYNAGRVRYSSEVHTFGDQDYIKVGKKAAGRELDGKTWNQFPEK